ncbi:MAG: tRNA (adenosine(37)-N6)-threonylcarbamoyltransferase complex dimerization subunit type 1 TsaB [Nitrospira sp. CR1.1]|jgi:tRNA threonylcarbamoyladenosine biosynthesis protein TsaB|nr:tRNA (adenosine(37)-N6)-threonylcarbamoyltransferase complex dimerization subunit type 1 TsaB [Nitrospira sp. CR1.1]
MRPQPDHYLLAIDTATAWQSVALLQCDKVLALVEQDADGSHARSLMGAIDRVLREGSITLKELQSLAVSIGPGSFTGLRVGLATMLGFRAVLGLPIAPVPTLEAMAWNLRDVKGLLVPVLKSRHNEVYWAAYEWLPESGLRTLIAEQVGPPASVARAVQAAKTCTCFGDGWQAYGKDIREAVESAGGQILEVSPEQQHPSAVSVGLAGRQRLDEGELAEQELVPRYVQRTEAEVKFDEQQGVSALERRRQRVASKLTQGRRRAVPKSADSRRTT